MLPVEKETSQKKDKKPTTALVNATVTKVIDGDTFEVSMSGKLAKVRVIGINTPETVDPRKKVECFGVEASEKAKEILTDKTVQLENDTTQTDKDKYGRLLRYVKLPDTSDFGNLMIQEGYAYEYTYDTVYKKQTLYKGAQTKAELAKLGLWADGMCGN